MLINRNIQIYEPGRIWDLCLNRFDTLSHEFNYVRSFFNHACKIMFWLEIEKVKYANFIQHLLLNHYIAWQERYTFLLAIQILGLFWFRFGAFTIYVYKIRGLGVILESETQKSKTSCGNIFTDIDILQWKLMTWCKI